MDPPRRHDSSDVESLDGMSRRLRQGETPSERQIEQVLERGFGKLMQLEADLQRQRRIGSDPGGAIPQLEEAIEDLREALTVLRTLSSPPGPARIGYGFVLPSQDVADCSPFSERRRP